VSVTFANTGFAETAANNVTVTVVGFELLSCEIPAVTPVASVENVYERAPFEPPIRTTAMSAALFVPGLTVTSGTGFFKVFVFGTSYGAGARKKSGRTGGGPGATGGGG
jgi:hypothetical protein